MNDIVERLREPPAGFYAPQDSLRVEAAEEIERLQTENNVLLRETINYSKTVERLQRQVKHWRMTFADLLKRERAEEFGSDYGTQMDADEVARDE